jgi:hypothetical protein
MCNNSVPCMLNHLRTPNDPGLTVLADFTVDHILTVVTAVVVTV